MYNRLRVNVVTTKIEGKNYIIVTPDIMIQKLKDLYQ